MKKAVKKLNLVLVGLLTVLLVSANLIFAAGTTSTTLVVDLWGNGYYTGRGSEKGEFAIGKNQPVTLKTSAYYKIEPYTSSHTVSNKVALRRHTLIGYETILSYAVFDGVELKNTSGSTSKSVTKEVTKSATIDKTDDYYIYASNSGGSTDYTCWYTFTITYGVN